MSPHRCAASKTTVPVLVPMLVPSLLVMMAAPAITSCSTDDYTTTEVVIGAQPGSPTQSEGFGLGLAAPEEPDSGHVDATPGQRAYLDALAAAGVRSSTSLMALSIGSYVCQARAAGQDADAVWDFVFPVVRGDIEHVVETDPALQSVTSAHDSTVQYIRIATERLCQ